MKSVCSSAQNIIIQQDMVSERLMIQLINQQLNLKLKLKKSKPSLWWLRLCCLTRVLSEYIPFSLDTGNTFFYFVNGISKQTLILCPAYAVLI